MNFTAKIRKDLIRDGSKERSACLALLAGFLDTSGGLVCNGYGRTEGFFFTSEDEEVAGYFISVAEKLFGVSMTVTEATRDPKQGRDKLTFSCSGGNAQQYGEELTEYGAVNLCGDEYVGIESCMRAYLIGAFLGGGSCTLPHGGVKTGYHLEFVYPDEARARSFLELLDRLQLIANCVPRGDKFVVYCKNRETISDFLAVAGAKNALRQLEEVSAARAASNNENRVSNCIQGNADKSAIASAAQVVAIEKMTEDGRLAGLPLPLRETAEARLENPELSFSELAARLNVTKSCLNHRMRKLMEIYGKEKL